MASRVTPIVLNFAHSPRAIVAAIRDLRARRRAATEGIGHSSLVVWGFVAGGLAMIALDRWLGYGSRLYTVVGVGAVVVGVWVLVRVAAARRQPSYDSEPVRTAEAVIHELRDDVAPKKLMHGSLDLRGVDDSKKSRTRRDSRGRTVSYYRDDWFSLKMKLYDGSMLRFSAVHRLKIRDGYYKRGRVSGKRKYKPPVTKSSVRKLVVTVSANPHLYVLAPGAAPVQGQVFGDCVVESVEIDDGRLRVIAAADGVPDANEILELLRLTYRTLERREVA